MIKELYHGSEKKIIVPKFGKGNPFNDYGKAFYMTDDVNMAMEWAVSRSRSGYANKYELDYTGLKVLNLCDEQYSILNWLAILVDNRTFDIQTDFGMEAKKYLLDTFLPDYEDYDVIVGYRADDSYFSFAQDFLNNVISVNTLSNAMYLGNLGVQTAIKSEKAFNRIKYVDAIDAKSAEWFPRKELRDETARSNYFAMKNQPWKRGELYMMMIIDQEVKPDDIRLRQKPSV